MDSIVLRVKDLESLVAAMAKDHMDYVEITLDGGDSADGGTLPPSAVFTGLRSSNTYELVDYDDLEGVPAGEADFNTIM